MSIEWDEERLITGVDAIDAEHARIVEYLNELKLAIGRGERAQIGKVLEELLDYLREHFAAEDALMEAAGYQYVEMHKKKHEIFIRRASAFVERYMQGEEIAEQIYTLLVRWLPKHIADEDSEIVEPIRAMIQRKDSSDQEESQNFFSKFVPKIFA